MAAQTAALGMILGCKREARLLAKALILAHRLKLFRYAQFYPASQCILQIFASYLERPPLVLKGEAATNPIYKALAVHWRHADGEALAPLLLALRRMAEAFGGVPKLAQTANLNATTLYRTLSPRGNPELKSLRVLLKAMGMRLAVQPIRGRGARQMPTAA